MNQSRTTASTVHPLRQIQRRSLWGRIQDLRAPRTLPRKLKETIKKKMDAVKKDSFVGVDIPKDNAMISMGVKTDVMMYRTAGGMLKIYSPGGVDFVTPTLTQNGQKIGGPAFGGLVVGCTEKAFVEFNPKANINDQKKCITKKVSGCTDPQYPEFNELANVQDGTCGTTVGLANKGFEYYPYDFCNLLQNVNLDKGWSKGYNRDIKW